jgi:hypothetical protein
LFYLKISSCYLPSFGFFISPQNLNKWSLSIN